MVTKVFCDRCGKEITKEDKSDFDRVFDTKFHEMESLWNTTIAGIKVPTLCEECSTEFKKRYRLFLNDFMGREIKVEELKVPKVSGSGMTLHINKKDKKPSKWGFLKGK